MRTDDELRADAVAIWQAGVEAVRGDHLVREAVRVEGKAGSRQLVFAGEEPCDLETIDRILVVGAGKAGAGMAAGFEAALGAELMQQKQLTGWLNVPADCVQPLAQIHLHAARPAGRNEPTAAGVAGAEEILRLVGDLGERDLCICLISGGGSALLPAPVPGVPLAEKLALTQHLSGAGANIHQLNTVRKQLSRIKGGGLAQACKAGRLVALVISDVIGDPLEIIASGPTVPDPSTPGDALAVLDEFDAHKVAPAAAAYLRAAAMESPPAATPTCRVSHFVIGSNSVAVDAAGIEAERRGYTHAMHAAGGQEPTAEEVGRHLANMARRMHAQSGPNCLITGGEPTVRLVPPEERGRGGRNQQLALAALVKLLEEGDENPLAGMALLSGGTDGEDGPTDAAGAVIGAGTVAALRARDLDPGEYLARNDAYSFFEQTGDLLKSGPTHTNVCDLRVVVVNRVARY